MEIKLATGINYITDTPQQSQETSDWLQENVLSKLGANLEEDPNFITPELDHYKRPYKWVYKGKGYTIEVIREYMAPGKWAKKGDTLTVKQNG